MSISLESFLTIRIFKRGKKMEKCRVVLSLLIIALLITGCASLEKQSGMIIAGKNPVGREEPWHNNALVGNVFTTERVSATYVQLPKPLPAGWKEELIDNSRVYEVKNPDNTKDRKSLTRVVFRALWYRNERLVGMSDAVLSPNLKGFFVLLPSDAKAYAGNNLVIVPSHPTWLMTTKGETVEMTAGQSFSKLPSGFFEKHPSVVKEVLYLDPNDPVGKQWFADMEEFFPMLLTIGGTRYSGRPDADIIAAKFTSVDNPVDRIISCGGMPISPGMITLGVAISVARNVYVGSRADCFH
jgi:hypothetical protein